MSELRRLGVWVVDGPALHVRYGRSAGRLDTRRRSHGGSPEVVRHQRRGPSPRPGGVGVLEALRDADRCLPTRLLRASVVSAVRAGWVTLDDVDRAIPRIAAGPPLDARCESGIETLAVDLARALGFHTRTQVVVRGIGRVDAVLEDVVVLEVDGAEFHTDAAADRRRDAALLLRGHPVLRLRYAHVVHDPGLAADLMIAAVASARGVANSGRILARARSRRIRIDPS